MIRILFVRHLKSCFIEEDIKLLRKNFDVKTFQLIWDVKFKIESIASILCLALDILQADVTFSWFADMHAYWAVLFSKFFRKKSVVVVGGYEVSVVPKVNYGALLDRNSSKIVKYILNNADLILTVDDGLRINAIDNAKVTGDNIKTIPTGYDHQKFSFQEEKEKMVLTVAYAGNWDTARLKGLDTFVQSANRLPEVKFIIIGVQGKASSKLKAIAHPNIEIIGFLPQDEIIPFYKRAKCYCQLSLSEGLPNALCEAMLCECVPVGTRIPGITTAIGDTGFYVQCGDISATVNAIKDALDSDKGKAARARVMKLFPSKRREIELKRAIIELTYS